jgi:hypothetical protein
MTAGLQSAAASSATIVGSVSDATAAPLETGAATGAVIETFAGAAAGRADNGSSLNSDSRPPRKGRSFRPQIAGRWDIPLDIFPTISTIDG